MSKRNSTRNATSSRRKKTQQRVGAFVAVTLIVFAGLITFYSVTALKGKQENRVNTAAANEAQNNAESNNATQPLLPTDERILLTPDALAQYSHTPEGSPICDAQFVNSAATTSVTYTNATHGFSVALPYNPDWGTEQYRLAPFDELRKPIDDGTGKVKATTQYGPMGVGEGCGWYRGLSVSVREARDLEQIKADLQNYPPSLAPREHALGKLKTVEYDVGALCGAPTIEVLGDTYNLVFAQLCGTDEVEKDIVKLRETVKTVEL
ncbi:MAG: hypothetical protein U0517_02225 [Candidatus Andersenbacteria bacterium]